MCHYHQPFRFYVIQWQCHIPQDKNSQRERFRLWLGYGSLSFIILKTVEPQQLDHCPSGQQSSEYAGHHTSVHTFGFSNLSSHILWLTSHPSLPPFFPIFFSLTSCHLQYTSVGITALSWATKWLHFNTLTGTLIHHLKMSTVKLVTNQPTNQLSLGTESSLRS